MGLVPIEIGLVPHICINFQLGGRVGPVDPCPKGGRGQGRASVGPSIFLYDKEETRSKLAMVQCQ